MTTERSGIVRALDAIADHPGVDVLIVAVLGGLHWFLLARGHTDLQLADVPPGQRLLVYGAVATVAALAAGSNNTAVGSYVGSTGEVIDKLRHSHGAQLRKALRSVGAWLWVVALASLVCLMLDPADDMHASSTGGAAVVIELAILMLGLKFARLTMIQDMILEANDLSAARSAQPPKRTIARKPVL